MMGALLSRCFDWRYDPDPISCRLLCSKTTGNRQRQIQQQLQQQQQQQTRKVSQESSCSASGAGPGSFHGPRRTGHVSFGHQPQQPPFASRSKEPVWSGMYSDSPPADHPSPTPKFLLVQQGHAAASPDGAAGGPATYGSCSFIYPQPPGGGDGGTPESRVQQHSSSKHLQCKDDSGIGRVKRTFSFRQRTGARPDGCDAGTNTRRAHHGSTRSHSFKMAD